MSVYASCTAKKQIMAASHSLHLRIGGMKPHEYTSAEEIASRTGLLANLLTGRIDALYKFVDDTTATIRSQPEMFQKTMLESLVPLVKSLICDLLIQTQNDIASY